MLTKDVAHAGVHASKMTRRDALQERLLHDFVRLLQGSATDRFSVIMFEDHTARAVLELRPLNMESGLQIKAAFAAPLPQAVRGAPWPHTF